LARRVPERLGRLDDPGRWKRRLPVLIAAAVVLAAIFISLFREMGVVGVWKLRDTEKQLQTEVERLRKENAELKSRVEGLRSNPAVIEDEARHLGLIKEREKVIVVPDRQDAPSHPPSRPGAKR
jgi:cell division protein FtsB